MGVAMGAIDTYDKDQLDVVEAELLRQRAGMTGRLSGANTRAAVLVGVTGAFGGTALVTGSGVWWISGISLLFYLAAAICGLRALRPMSGREVDVTNLILDNQNTTTVTVQRAVILSNLDAHADYLTSLTNRSKWLRWGFGLLVVAWSISGLATVYGLENHGDTPPMKIQIVKER
jgi:hypothetical protein